MDDIVIVGFTRTPLGMLQGQLSSFSAAQLGAEVITSLLQKTNVPKNTIDAVVMGCVLQAGIGQSPTRQAALFAKLDNSVSSLTVNKVCGSGLEAIILASEYIKTNRYQMIVAGGMESMTNAPFILKNIRNGYKMGHQQLIDSMCLDGLEDAYEKKLMGHFGELTAEKYHLTRAMQDEFAIHGVAKAQTALKNKIWSHEITPISLKNKDGVTVLDTDEGILKAKPDKIPTLKPVFKADGTITAANASSIADGAAGILVTSLRMAKQLNLKPLAKIIGYKSYAHEPSWFTTAPIGAIKSLLAALKLTVNDIDLFELNEAFAVVTMAATQELALPKDKVNIYGGAVVLGHPLGASGARILCTLLNGLIQTNKNRGIAALCIGGGEALALAIERL